MRSRDCDRCNRPFTPKCSRHRICEDCKRCVSCGKPTGDARKRYCGNECYWTAKRMEQIPCGHCGEPVPRIRSRKAVYCSAECRTAANCGRVIVGPRGYLLERTPEGWIYAHRAVMQRVVGRRLERHEVVHHRNGVKTDNRPENLELCLVGEHSHPPGQRIEDLVGWAEAILAEYQPIMKTLERKDSH